MPRARDTQDTNLLSLQARRHWSVHVEQHGPVPGVTATDRMGNSEVDCRKNLHTRKRVRGKTRNLRTNERREALPERRPRPVFNRTGHFSGQNVGMQRMSPQSDARLRRRQGETPSDGFSDKTSVRFFYTSGVAEWVGHMGFAPWRCFPLHLSLLVHFLLAIRANASGRPGAPN